MPKPLFKNSKGPWPVTAEAEEYKLEFSGVFSPNRIRSEQLSASLETAVKITLWLLVGLGSMALAFSIFSGWLDKNPAFLLKKSPANLAFWVSVFTSCYLWSKYKQEDLNDAALNLLRLGKQTANKPRLALDVYRLFNREAKRAWNRALEVSQSRRQALAGLGKKEAGLKDRTMPVLAADLFLSLLEERDIQLVFLRLGVPASYIRTVVKNHAILSPQQSPAELDQVPFLAFFESIKLHNKTIDPLMLLCALAITLPEEHIIQSVFFNINLSLEKLEIISSWIFNLDLLRDDLKLFRRLSRFKPDKEINKGLTSVPTYFLDRYSTDLTWLAKHGGLPLAYGRANDLTELFKLLSEGKNSLVIKGPEGAGRTTLINELAYKMATEQVPHLLEDKRLVRLEIAAILGNAEKAETALVHALKEAAGAGNIVLVIEDLHDLAKSATGNGLTLLELLVDFLQSHNLAVIGTTTVENFSDYLQDTPSFAEAFSAYELSRLSREGVLLACCIRTSFLEGRNRCFFRYQAIEQAMELTDLYQKGVSQPQKAIAVLVEAASRVKDSQNKVVTEELIEKIISEKTHIPSQTLSQNEAEKLLGLEAELGKYIIGQRQAVRAVCEGLRRARSGLASASRPLASFLFLGPTGVGKTEITKTLARVYFGEEKYLLRLDMSEYQGEGGLVKLLGSETSRLDSPLVKHVKNYPFSLLLLDEFEKAGPQILNLFLQVLEDGRLTSGKGETLDLTHCLIIATSNAGTKEIQEGLKEGKNMEQIKIRLFNQTLLKSYSPELLNRFDGIVLFSPLDPQEVEQITYLQLQYLTDRLRDKGIKISFSDSVAKHVAQNAFDPLLGARPIRRFIQDFVESFVAKLLLSRQAQRGTELRVDIKDGELVIS